MNSWRSTLWIAFAIASQSGWAQAPNPPAAPAGSSGEGQHATGAAFVQEAAEINLTELELSKLALNNSTTPVFIKFSRVLVRELTESNRSLRVAAERNGLSVPTSLDAEHAAMVERLRSESGPDFESDYAKYMAMNEARAMALYQAETADGNPDLSSYAQKTLPAIEEHAKVAQSLTSTAIPDIG
jgi:putative membrane protein